MSQNYENHKRFYSPFHFFAVPLTVIGLCFSISSCIAIPTIITGLLVLAFFLIAIIAIMARMFALKAQDRAARAEENLRYYMLAGSALPNELSISQILALRFAGDEEFLPLVDQAVNNKLSPTEIKKSINNWRGDYHRI